MPTTTLYLVRHAEQKHAADATADDPRAGLTAAGAVPERYRAFLAAVPGNERDEGARHLSAAAAELLTVADRDRAEILVTHTFVVGWLVRQVLDAPAWRWIGLDAAHCGLTTIAVHDDRPAMLLGYNDVGHLR